MCYETTYSIESSIMRSYGYKQRLNVSLESDQIRSIVLISTQVPRKSLKTSITTARNKVENAAQNWNPRKVTMFARRRYRRSKVIDMTVQMTDKSWEAYLS